MNANDQKTNKMADFKHIIRIVNTDLDGHKPISHALKKIKGVSSIFANAICLTTNINKTKKSGELSDAEVKKIHDVLKNPEGAGFPSWMLNRRKDYETGVDKHVLTSDMDFIQNNDVRRLMKTKSNRGLRLAAGLPVRGQRTRSNFRRNKGKVQGVKRKSK